MLAAFEGLAGPVAFTGCDEVADGVAAILRGWRMRKLDPAASPAPVIRIRHTPRGYLCVSPRLSKPSLCREKLRTGAVQAVCVLHSEFIRQHLNEDRTLACLHCAALEFDRGLVLLIGHYRAGKSTLAVHLAAAGARLYCDDILPIDATGSLGVAPGFLPRLRLPLAPNLSQRFLNFLGRREGPRNKKSFYVALRDDEIAPLGTKAPIVGIVRLKRHDEGRPVLVPTTRSEMLRTVLRRNIARGLPTRDLLDRLHPVVEEASCFTLNYARCDEAVAMLGDAFGSAAAPGIAA